MSQYSELLKLNAETLSPDDDDYEERLLENASLFRGFDEALTAFIVEHGYMGNPSDVEAKSKFLEDKYEAAGVETPRSFKEWFVPVKRLDRKTVFRVCFVFGLDVAGTNDFFRRVRFDRSFDCHTISEAVYYFCIKNGLKYSDAQEIINRIPKPKKLPSLPKREVLYTGTIVDYIDSIDDKEQLIQYITDNIHDFEYNNATAIKFIQKLWEEIANENGLAVKEGQIISRTYTYNQFEDKHKKYITDTRSAEVIASEVWYQENAVKPGDRVVATTDSSSWIIFSQIMGLSNYDENKYATKHDRSLSSVLDDNKLLPLKASYCFPSRQNIDKLLRSEMGENETVRKMLIFLVFYTYWVKKIIKSKDPFYVATLSDSEGCLDTINGYLSDAGYPKMYEGNPYDWLFMWAIKPKRKIGSNVNPLEAFRVYIGEVFAIASEEVLPDQEC